jgi:hypothetical protein
LGYQSLLSAPRNIGEMLLLRKHMFQIDMHRLTASCTCPSIKPSRQARYVRSPVYSSSRQVGLSTTEMQAPIYSPSFITPQRHLTSHWRYHVINCAFLHVMRDISAADLPVLLISLPTPYSLPVKCAAVKPVLRVRLIPALACNNQVYAIATVFVDQ